MVCLEEIRRVKHKIKRYTLWNKVVGSWYSMVCLEEIRKAKHSVLMLSNNILWTNQFGFCKNSNTSDSIIEFLDYVYSSSDSKQSTIALYLDFSKAFDTVNHNILMSKFLHNGVRGVMQRWFESYLSNRKQYVSIKNMQFLYVKHYIGCSTRLGVGLVVFLLYINDMYR